MKLTKTIPTHIITEEFIACKKNFTIFDESFRRTRSRLRNPMDKCYWCKNSFIDGDHLAIAFRISKPNVVLCEKCTDKLLKSKKESS